MSKAIKSAFFSLLLIAAGYFFGMSCRSISRDFELLVTFSADAVGPVLYLLAALGAMVLTASLVAALLRPTWACLIAILLSSAAMVVALGPSVRSGGLALLYLMASSLYARNVIKGLGQRIRFSVQPISQSQTVLVVALVLVAAASFYFPYAAKIRAEGFSIPSSAMDAMLEMIEGQIKTRAPEMGPTEREQFLSEFRAQVETQVQDVIEPYERYVPAAVALGFLSPLWTAYTLLSWVPGLILRLIFPLLALLRITRVVSETREVSWVSLS